MWSYVPTIVYIQYMNNIVLRKAKSLAGTTHLIHESVEWAGKLWFVTFAKKPFDMPDQSIMWDTWHTGEIWARTLYSRCLYFLCWNIVVHIIKEVLFGDLEIRNLPHSWSTFIPPSMLIWDDFLLIKIKKKIDIKVSFIKPYLTFLSVISGLYWDNGFFGKVCLIGSLVSVYSVLFTRLKVRLSQPEKKKLWDF